MKRIVKYQLQNSIILLTFKVTKMVTFSQTLELKY